MVKGREGEGGRMEVGVGMGSEREEVTMVWVGEGWGVGKM